MFRVEKVDAFNCSGGVRHYFKFQLVKIQIKFVEQQNNKLHSSTNDCLSFSTCGHNNAMELSTCGHNNAIEFSTCGNNNAIEFYLVHVWYIRHSDTMK